MRRIMWETQHTHSRLCCQRSFWLVLQQPIDTCRDVFQSWLMVALSPVVSHLFRLFFFMLNAHKMPYGAFTKVYLNYAFFLSFHIWSPKWVLATGMATHPSITFWSPKLDRPGSRGPCRHQATGVFAGRWRHPALNKPLLWLPVIPRPRVGLMAAWTP